MLVVGRENELCNSCSPFVSVKIYMKILCLMEGVIDMNCNLYLIWSKYT
jgi:hypothetical protein